MKALFAKIQHKFCTFSAMMAVAFMMAVPAFAVDSSAAATLDPALFDPLVSGITSNISAVLPKVLLVVALLVGLSVVIMLFKKHAKPS